VDETLTEKEQIDEIRAWWSENGNYIIAGLVLGIGGIFGYNQWQGSKLDTQLEASALYESLVNEVADDRLEPAEEIAANIFTNYADTVYADEARLAMARLFMDQGRDQDAAAVLQELLTSGGFPEMQMVGRLRLAKIMLYQSKPEEVLTLLDGQMDNAFASRYYEILGDAHFALGNFDEAQTAYLAALSEPSAAQVIDANLVQMKINDLPEIEAIDAEQAEDMTAVPADEASEVIEAADTVVGDETEAAEAPE
jgi:predicted negative regulator of RcsB-dependent stress response